MLRLWSASWRLEEAVQTHQRRAIHSSPETLYFSALAGHKNRGSLRHSLAANQSDGSDPPVSADSTVRWSSSCLGGEPGGDMVAVRIEGPGRIQWVDFANSLQFTSQARRKRSKHLNLYIRTSRMSKCSGAVETSQYSGRGTGRHRCLFTLPHTQVTSGTSSVDRGCSFLLLCGGTDWLPVSIGRHPAYSDCRLQPIALLLTVDLDSTSPTRTTAPFLRLIRAHTKQGYPKSSHPHAPTSTPRSPHTTTD